MKPNTKHIIAALSQILRNQIALADLIAKSDHTYIQVGNFLISKAQDDANRIAAETNETLKLLED